MQPYTQSNTDKLIMTNNYFWFPDKKERAKLWNNWNWQEAEEHLLEMQRKVASAATSKDSALLKAAQQEILQSLGARMLAVRHASETSSGPGIDGVHLSRPADKMQMAMGLREDIKNYKATPTRLLVVQPKRGKERSIKIPIIYDRAMQTLYAYTIAPVADIKGDKKSFGFKRCRSAMDAHHYVMKIFSDSIDGEGLFEKAPEYIVLTDVKACYESITHRWLMNNIPMDKNVLQEFLKAGHVFDGEFFPAESHGISLGSGLSPYLANMTLDGLQNVIYQGLYEQGAVDWNGGNMVRFADDIIVSARTKNQAYDIMGIISRFLRVRGLMLSPTKTKVVKAENGFDFLSRHYQRVDGMIFSRPSDSAVADFKMELTGCQRYFCLYR